jgi:cobalt/nickel transport system permease protein
LRELYAHQQSFIHQMDARVKVIFTLAFIFFLSLTPPGAWPAYILFFTLILAAVLLSRLGVGFVFKRSLLAIPFVLAALPLVFFGPQPHASLTVFQGFQIPYSPAGVERFVSILVKSWISVQAAILLAATTRVPDLLVALRQLKVPRLFVAIVGLMWRYLFVISEEALRMLRARKSRSAALPGARHVGGTLLWRARVTGGMAGSLLLRSLERSDRVYAAMLSRGYNGEPPVLDTVPLSKEDRWTLLLGIVLLTFLWLLGWLSGG